MIKARGRQIKGPDVMIVSTFKKIPGRPVNKGESDRR